MSEPSAERLYVLEYQLETTELRAEAAEAERDALRDDCRTLLMTIFKHVDPDALPNYEEVLSISSRVPPLTTPPPGESDDVR